MLCILISKILSYQLKCDRYNMDITVTSSSSSYLRFTSTTTLHSPQLLTISLILCHLFMFFYLYCVEHKCTGRKNLGGCPTQSPLFADIFARLRTKICPNGADFENFFKVGGLLPPGAPPASYAYGVESTISVALY